jgi:hypothetical protein
MTHWSLSNVLLSFQLFVYFLLLFLLLSSSFNALWSDGMQGIISIFYICWGLLCALRYDQFLRRFYGLLRRMYIVQMLDEMFCRHQVGPFDLWCDLVLKFLHWFFCLDDLSIGDRVILKSPISTVLESISAFKSFKVCLMKLDALRLGAYRLIIFISFWCILPFITIKCPSLSHLINVSLKSTLSEISIITPSCCWGDHWLGKSSSSLLPQTSVCFCQWDGSPVNNRLLDLSF